MLTGIDISRYQKTMNTFKGYDFVIMKASEGKTYMDTELNNHYNRLHGSNDGVPDSTKLYGFYHFARPENNTPEQEAEFFLSLVGHHKGHCLFVLDWEAQALKYPIGWALKWLDIVYKKTGVRPLLYCQASYTTKCKPISDAGYELWVAHYGVKAPKVGAFKTWKLWQYTQTPLDKDKFNGTVEDWKELCKIQKK